MGLVPLWLHGGDWLIHWATMAGVRVEQYPVIATLGFSMLMVVVLALGFPAGVLMSMIAGYLFGWVHGALVALAGTVGGAILTYGLAHHLLHRRFPGRLDHPLIARIRRLVTVDEFHYLLLLRILPIFPFFAVNIALPVIGIRFSSFLLTTALGVIPGLLIYAGMGRGLESILQAGETSAWQLLTQPALALPLAGLLLLMSCSMAFRRHANGRVRAAPTLDFRRSR